MRAQGGAQGRWTGLGRLTIGLLAGGALLGTGCGAGFNAGTTVQQTVTAGAYGAVGAIAAQNVVLVRTGEASSLIATIVNNAETPDTLTAVLVEPEPLDIVSTTGGTIPIPAGTTRIGFSGGEEVVLTGFNPEPSAFVSVVLSFEVAGDIPLEVLVVPPTGPFAGLGPTP